jgi:flagellar L-ring protein precursor FlgH
MDMNLRKYVLIGMSIMVLSACNSTTGPKRDPEFAASLPPVVPEPVQANGTIYQPGNNLFLFEDLRARRVGDVLTIRLVESTAGSKSANTSSERSQATDVANPTLFGTTPQFDVPNIAPLANTSDLTLQQSLQSDHEFDGGGQSSQSNTLEGDITVTVAAVLPNGNLVIRGEKRINLNQGNEYVKISGMVRPADIVNNTVLSTRVADATIIYSGDGSIADANKLGWLARFFISAIFPF